MAVIESWVYQDLNKPVQVRYIKGNIFQDDNNGNLFGVIVTDNGSSASLTGTVIGYCIRANGTTVPVSGTLSSNKASIVLPDSAYAIPGQLNIIIKLSGSSVATTLAFIVATVIGIGSINATPSDQTIEEWTRMINATISSLENGAVRYDESQSLTLSQKLQARTNIGANTSAVLVSGNDYKITIP